jgi:hypothetical protein
MKSGLAILVNAVVFDEIEPEAFWTEKHKEEAAFTNGNLSDARS